MEEYMVKKGQNFEQMKCQSGWMQQITLHEQIRAEIKHSETVGCAAIFLTRTIHHDIFG